MTLAFQILALWFAAAIVAAAIFSLIRTHQKRRARADYDLALAPYRPSIKATYRKGEGR